jgi:short-subunit dehydrogenase
MRLVKRRVLLTGASGGIGQAVARELSAAGASLVLSGRDAETLRDLAAELERAGGDAEVVCGDLSSRDGVERIVALALERESRLDLLVNAAGVAHFGAFESTPDDVLERLLSTNMLAPMRLVQAALPALRQVSGAMVVNVGSIFGSIGFPCFAAYSATKFALRGFSEALRRELKDADVEVLYFAPRYTRTAFNAGPAERMAAALHMNQDSPELVARQLVQAIERRARERYLGWPEKAFVRLNSLFPRLLDGALAKRSGHMLPYALQKLS